MLGHTHALSGAAAGAAAGLYLLHAHPVATAELAGLTACWATFPDLDSVGSCAARGLGFASAAVAHVVRFVSRGHRHGTHTLAGVAAFTALAGLACYYRHDPAGRWCLAAFLALALAAGMGALRVGRWRVLGFRLGDHGAEALAVILAGLMAWRGYALALVPLACGLGCLTHLIGDGCTDQGVPFLSPFVGGHQHLLPEPLAFTTSTRPERWVVAPALLLAICWLGYHVAALAHR